MRHRDSFSYALSDVWQLYAFGGTASSDFAGLRVVEIFDLTTATWTTGTPMVKGLYGLEAAVLGTQ